MQNNDALCSPHKLCSECKPNGNICSADNKYYDILGIKGNFLEALQVQKKDLRVCPVQSICSAGCSPISHFLCNVSVQCQRIGRKWMYDQHRTQDISHIRCANIFFAMQDFSGFLRKSTIENGISSSVQLCSALYFPHCPFLSITSQSVSNSGLLPITKASFTLGAGKVDLYINLPTIANEHHNCQWRDNVTMEMFPIFVAGEVANNWLEDQLNGQSKGEEWLCLHIWTHQR